MLHQDNPDLQLWLREAKILQKAAKSPSLAQSLPVLRRLLNSEVLTDISLLELKSNTEIIQRKHLLNMLAIENGSRCWKDFRQQVAAAEQGSILPNSIELRDAGYPVLWFSTVLEANSYTDQHGGRVIKVGSQAAVVPQ